MTDETPIKCKQHLLPPAHREIIKKDVEDKLRIGVIEPSNRPMSSPFMIVPKKCDKFSCPKYRLVLDYRLVN